MLGKVILRLGPGIRAVGTAGALLVLTVGSVGTAGATTTLQNLFADADDLDAVSDGAFTQDGLTFSEFKPALSSTLGSDLPTAMSAILGAPDPISIVVPTLSSLQVLELGSDPREFSFGWLLTGADGTAADASGIDVTVLPDNPITVGNDPGFRLDTESQWNVIGGMTGSAQLSAFEYTVTTGDPLNEPITSADVLQISELLDTDIGPDTFEDGWPDAAAGFSLQFVLDDQDPTNISAALMNYTLETGVRLGDFFSQLLGSPDIWSTPFDQDYDWTGFVGRESVRVVSVTGLLATSGSQFTMDALEQRIDPPPNPAIPEPQTALLLLMGMLGIGAARRRSV